MPKVRKTLGAARCEEERVLRSDVVRDMASHMESLGVEPVGVLPGPMQYLLTTMPVGKPADLSGRVIGYSGYAHAAWTLKALGARPRPVPAAPPDYDGLDGALANTDPLTGSGFHRQARHLVANIAFWPRPIVVFASPRVDSADLETLRRAATAAFPQVLAQEEDREREQTREMCRAGVQPDQVDVAAMKRAVRPVYDRLASDPGTSRVIRSIQTIASGVDAPRAALRCASASRAAEETIPVGTYEVTITRADAREASLEDDFSEGSRRFTLEIRPDEFILRDVTEIGSQGPYSRPCQRPGRRSRLVRERSRLPNRKNPARNPSPPIMSGKPPIRAFAEAAGRVPRRRGIQACHGECRQCRRRWSAVADHACCRAPTLV